MSNNCKVKNKIRLQIYPKIGISEHGLLGLLLFYFFLYLFNKQIYLSLNDSCRELKKNRLLEM